MSPTVNSLDLTEVESTKIGENRALVRRDLDIIKHVTVELVAEIGVAQLSVEGLFSLRSGDVVKLDQGLSDQVTLCLDGKPIALGVLVAVDDNFGVQIKSIL